MGLALEKNGKYILAKGYFLAKVVLQRFGISRKWYLTNCKLKSQKSIMKDLRVRSGKM